MRKTVFIGGAEIEIYSNAATPLYFKHIFQDDILRHISAEEDDVVRTDALMKLAYVEAMQARSLSTGELIKLRETDFISWLEHYEWTDMIDAANAAQCCFLGIDDDAPQEHAEDDQKNAPEGQSGS